MKEILETQKKHLEERQARDHRDDQMTLGFSEEERRQIDSERKCWRKRLLELPHELETEPQRIRGLYEVRAQRIEPVGLVYLWPVTR